MSDALLRFVVLEHDWNGIHYDLMLEQNGVLKTWRLAALLQDGEQAAEELPDHRLDYLDYEGPVSGGRGTVRRLGRGTYSTDLVDATNYQLRLQGDLVGRLVLQRRTAGQWVVRWSEGRAL